MVYVSVAEHCRERHLVRVGRSLQAATNPLWKSGGVDSALPMRGIAASPGAPVSIATQSVNVPPISTPTRYRTCSFSI
jgi:hypothetical protein